VAILTCWGPRTLDDIRDAHSVQEVYIRQAMPSAVLVLRVAVKAGGAARLNVM